MTITIPSNVIPLLILPIALLVLGVRSLLRYRQVNSPLIYNYALTATLAGLSSLFYSFPFLISQNELWLKIAVTVGDILYYAAAISMLKIVWYLGVRQRFSFKWLFWPALILSIISLILDVLYRIDIFFGVVDNIAIYPIAPTTLKILAFLTLAYVIGGALTIREAYTISDKRQRLRLLSIGGMILLGGFIAIYNFLFLQGSNASSTSLVGYLVVTLLFFAGLFIIKRAPKDRA